MDFLVLLLLRHNSGFLDARWKMLDVCDEQDTIRTRTEKERIERAKEENTRHPDKQRKWEQMQ